MLIMRREQTGHCMICEFRKTSQMFTEKQTGQNQAYVKVSGVDVSTVTMAPSGGVSLRKTNRGRTRILP